jgi:hypothetical protein
MKKYSQIASIILLRINGVFLEFAKGAGQALRS